MAPKEGPKVEKIKNVGECLDGLTKAARDLLEKARSGLKDLSGDFSDGFDKAVSDSLIGMNEAQLTDFLDQLNKLNLVDEVAVKSLLFRVEYLGIQKKDGDKKADSLLKTADEKFKSLVADLKKMKDDGVSRLQVYKYLVSLHGNYKEDSSNVLGLLANGEGNCEARAKLMVMLLNEVFGKEMDVKVQMLYVQDSETGELVKHTRAVVKDGGKYYALELPEVKVLTAKEADPSTLYETDVFAKGYLAGHGRFEFDKTKDKAPTGKISDGKTDTVLDLPSSTLVMAQNPNVGFSDVVQKKIEGLAKKKGYKTLSESNSEEGIDTVSYDFIDNLNDPDIAREIISNANQNKVQHLFFQGLKKLTPECAEILAGFNGSWLYLGARTGLELNAENSKPFVNYQKGLYLTVSAEKLTDEVIHNISKVGTTYHKWNYKQNDYHEIYRDRLYVNVVGILSSELFDKFHSNDARNWGFSASKGVDPKIVQSLAEQGEKNSRAYDSFELYNINADMSYSLLESIVMSRFGACRFVTRDGYSLEEASGNFYYPAVISDTFRIKVKEFNSEMAKLFSHFTELSILTDKPLSEEVLEILTPKDPNNITGRVTRKLTVNGKRVFWYPTDYENYPRNNNGQTGYWDNR